MEHELFLIVLIPFDSIEVYASQILCDLKTRDLKTRFHSTRFRVFPFPISFCVDYFWKEKCRVKLKVLNVLKVTIHDY